MVWKQASSKVYCAGGTEVALGEVWEIIFLFPLGACATVGVEAMGGVGCNAAGTISDVEIEALDLAVGLDSGLVVRTSETEVAGAVGSKCGGQVGSMVEA